MFSVGGGGSRRSGAMTSRSATVAGFATNAPLVPRILETGSIFTPVEGSDDRMT
jgi:hypothetical protein